MLNVKAFGITCAVMWTIAVVWTVVLAMLGKGLAPFNVVNQFYLGWLAPTIVGLIIAIVIALVDGFIFGAIFAWIYNKIKG